MTVFEHVALIGITLAAFMVSPTFASPVIAKGNSNCTGLPLSSHVVTRFPNQTWLENIAVRSNGDLLVTLLTTPMPGSLYSISDPTSYSPIVTLIAGLESVVLLGIAETEPDLFVVAAATFEVLTIDFNDLDASGNPAVNIVATITGAKSLNGMTAISDSVVLIADFFAGLAWRVDITTGEVVQGIKVPEMLAADGTQVGINGLHIFEGYLYWTNSFETTIYRTAINGDGYAVDLSKVGTLADVNSTFLDDFIFDKEGNMWIATGKDNRVLVAKPSGEIVVVEGAVDELTVAGATAAAFGRGGNDKNVLYVTTSGQIKNAFVEGGKVVAVDTRGFKL